MRRGRENERASERMYRRDPLVRTEKKQRVASPQHRQQGNEDYDDGEGEGIRSFLQEFKQDFPVAAATTTTTAGLQDPPPRTEGFGDPIKRKEIKEQFIERGAQLIDKAKACVEASKVGGIGLQGASANLGYPNLRFVFPATDLVRRPVQNVLYEPGFFAVGDGVEWGIRPTEAQVVFPYQRDVISTLAPRNYHNQITHTPEVISGLMDSAWRDLYFLCAMVIHNVALDSFQFNPEMTLRVPNEFDKVTRLKFLDLNTPSGSKYYSVGETLTAVQGYIPAPYNDSWFEADIPMFFDRSQFGNEKPGKLAALERKYLLSCLDKAAFLANYGPLFQASLGYDKTQITSANPFQVDAAGLQEEEITAKILKTFQEEMDQVNYLLAGWKASLEIHLQPAENLLAGLDILSVSPDENLLTGPIDATSVRQFMRPNSPKEIATFEVEYASRVKEAKEKITRDLLEPITKSIKSLEAFQETSIARKRADLKVRKLEGDILRMKNQPGGGGGAGGESTNAAADTRAQKVYLEAVVRLEVYKLLRQKYKLFTFADLVAGGTVSSLQRLLRSDYDDMITKEIMRRLPPDTVTLPEVGGADGYFELATRPFQDSFGTEMFFTPQFQFAVAKCSEKVRSMIQIAAKANRRGKTVIHLQDLTQGERELTVAFASSVSLEMAATQEVQRKVSSAHHDQVLLLANAQNADSLLRAILNKLGWACFSSPYEEANAKPSRLGVF